MSATPSIFQIKTATAMEYGLTTVTLDSRRQHRSIARPRQVAMYLAKELTIHSFPVIGREFGGRDHTTVMHACRRIDELQLLSPEIRTRVDDLRRRLTDPSELAAIAPSVNLTDAAALAMSNAVKAVKSGAGARVFGATDIMRGALLNTFNERPLYAGASPGGAIVETLVSPAGSWSRIEILNGEAELVESGTGWRNL